MRLLGKFLWLLFNLLYVRPYLRRNGVTVVNRDRLPRTGPAILVVAPHASVIEPSIIQGIYPIHSLFRVIPTGADDFFRKGGKVVYALATYVLGVCFLERDSGERARVGEGDPFAAVYEHLRREEIVIYFPQGTRQEGASFKKGVYHLHRGAPSGTVVIPVRLEGSRGLFSAGNWLPLPAHFHVSVGEPFTLLPGDSPATYVARLEAMLYALP